MQLHRSYMQLIITHLKAVYSFNLYALHAARLFNVWLNLSCF